MIGLHFFSPANVMRLLEIVRGDKTAPDVLATCMALAKKIKKIGVVSGVCDGFIGNRMLAKYGAAANGLLMQGALPQQVDKALEKFGFAMGPFRVGDLAGLDIGWAGRKRRAAENPQRLSARGGRPHLRGRPLRPEDRRRLVPLRARRARSDSRSGGHRDHRAVPQGARHHARARSATTRWSSAACSRWSTKARASSKRGIAARACDIDVVYLNGYGFPQHRGGPMLYADIVGLPNVVRALKRFAAEPGAEAWWQPAPLLQQLADDGKSFN